jgi:hypothetical protein
MTEAEWEGCYDPRAMLDLIEEWVGDRKLRLFACACGREVWGFLRHDWARRTLGAVEDYLEGHITAVEAALAWEQLNAGLAATLEDLAWPQAAPRRGFQPSAP